MQKRDREGSLDSKSQNLYNWVEKVRKRKAEDREFWYNTICIYISIYKDNTYVYTRKVRENMKVIAIANQKALHHKSTKYKLYIN